MQHIERWEWSSLGLLRGAAGAKGLVLLSCGSFSAPLLQRRGAKAAAQASERGERRRCPSRDGISFLPALRGRSCLPLPASSARQAGEKCTWTAGEQHRRRSAVRLPPQKPLECVGGWCSLGVQLRVRHPSQHHLVSLRSHAVWLQLQAPAVGVHRRLSSAVATVFT